MAISDVNYPLMVVGDFNCVLDQSEKIGGKPINEMAVNEFLDMVQYANLIDAGFEGNMATWSNKRMGRRVIYQRLDRVLYNEKWLHLFHATRVTHLSKACSDHAPLVIIITLQGEEKEVCFIFSIFGLSTMTSPTLSVVLTPMEGRPMEFLSEGLQEKTHTRTKIKFSLSVCRNPN